MHVQSGEKMNAYQRVGRADALYLSIAITVTIIELAIIATTPTLGAFALEYALIAQLAISIFVEFGIAYLLVASLGIIRATHVGFAFKTTSCCLFFGGLFVAEHSFTYSWLLIFGSFLFDSMGTGLLRAAFRPAYSAMHHSAEGKPADYMANLESFGTIRLALPCVLMFLIGLTNFFSTQTTSLYVMCFTVLACRLLQVSITKFDLRAITPTRHPHVANKTKPSVSVLKSLKAAPILWTCYTAGTLFESIILMYGIGLIYKHKGNFQLPDAVTWMGASAISLLIYLISYTGAGYALRYWSHLKNNRLCLIACFLLAVTIVYLLLSDQREAGYLVGLLGFCFSASASALLLVRHASTQFLLIYNEQDAARVFLWAELATNIALIIIVGTVATLIGPENILLMFGILFGLSTTVVTFFSITKRQSC